MNNFDLSHLLGKFVTAKLIGKNETRQGWVIGIDPLAIEGQDKIPYICEGVPTIVENPPKYKSRIKHKDNIEFYKKARRCAKCVTTSSNYKFIRKFQNHHIYDSDGSLKWISAEREIIERVCCNCGHIWFELPLDYEEEKN
jgi:hypothetical protein